MRIGIDVDETLTDTEESFNRVIKKYNLNVSSDYKSKWSRKDYSTLCNYLKEILGDAKLKKDAVRIITRLNELGHELFVITARSNRHCNGIEKITLDMINNNKLNFKDVYFNQNKKSDLAKKLKIDLMIDDSIDVYNNMKSEKIDCILFGDVINSWEDVLKYIERKEQQDG